MPSKIGSYQILAKLGQGGMATVYRAMQASLKREVALKVVSAAFSGDPAFCERFLREARAGALVNHPNVVTCFDAGEADGQLYMAMELVTGGDLAQLIDKRGGRLDEKLALALLKDATSGLEAIEAARLVHRDIKPANIFLTDHGQAKLADLGLVCFSTGDDRMTKPGTVMGTPAYIAPEQARGVPDVDIRADIYSLGATLFHLVTGQPPYASESPITTLVKSLNEPMPDPRSLRPDISPTTVAIISFASDKDREKRYQSARQLREDLECALNGQRLRHAQVPSSLTRNTTPTATTPTKAPTPTITQRVSTPPSVTPVSSSRPPTPPPGNPKINAEQLKLLTKRIVLDGEVLKAWLVLAPGASFPRFMLEQILEAAGICYGVDQGAVNEATRPSTLPRRIILARGDPATPGFGGTNVRGESIPPLIVPVSITVAEDMMSAVALTQPGKLITKEQLEPVLKRSGLRFGIDVVGLHRLVEGPADSQGRMEIARGRAPIPGKCAGFHLGTAVNNTTVDDLARTRNLQRVQPGTVLATWQDTITGSDGMDVLGRVVPVAAVAELKPEDCAGEGTEVGRDRTGSLVLRATRVGLCQQQVDGLVRVVGAVEIPGDLGPDSPPVVSDDLVVVRGNVKAGAKISCTSDVVIIGDLEDAAISVGGSLEINGSIGPGDQEVVAGGTLIAGAANVRRIMAGNLKISGEARNCALLASGDIQVAKVVGGSLTAGGSVSVGTAGDKDGTTTELWAGHNLSYQQQNQLAKLEAERLDAERSRLIAHCRAMETEVVAAQGRNQRLVGAQFVRKEALDALQRQLQDLADSKKRLSEDGEHSRKQLARQRKLVSDLTNLGDNDKAAVKVGVVAHSGVVARLADIEPEVLNEPRLQYRLGTSKPSA
jgi:serine/threonine protein kinase/uncharacterized protein (DUF342 family)